MNKLLKNGRAVTPVLSNVLLLLIVLAGMSLAIAATYVITANLRATMGERYIVEDVWFVDGQISIYVRNTGKVAIRFVAVYVNHSSQPFTPLQLEPIEHGWLNVTYSWSSNMLYHINVVTSRGTQTADYYRSST